MSSDNGETQNETPSESDKMDISEVSDQVSPVSDQSPSETVDNPAPKESAPERLTSLDNASAVVSATTTNTAITTTTTDNPTRDRLDSALSLEGFDLELPTLDTYQEEYVDFPSSPKQLKECLEAHGLAMPLERDSGTTGRSEEEDEEDTSIYQAVLSPDCQDVRLKKEHSEETDSIKLAIRNSTSCYQDEITSSESKSDTAEVKYINEVDFPKQKLRRVLTPNPEDTLLPNLYGNRSAIVVLADTVPEPSPNTLLSKAMSSHDLKIVPSRQNSSGINMKMKSKSTLDLSLPSAFSSDSVSEDSNFIFERRNSKRLAKKDFGGRVVEGLFVESPRIKDGSDNVTSGLRKISLSQSLQTMESPTGEDSIVSAVNSPCESELQNKHSLVPNSEEKLNNEQYQMPSDLQNKIIASVVVHNELRSPYPLKHQENGDYKPIPNVRTKSTTKIASGINSSENSSFVAPPRPRPRRKLKDNSQEPTRGPVLLDPTALQHQTVNKGAPIINPDGSVEIRQERPGSLVAPQRGGRRKIRVSADILAGSGSCGDTTADGDESSVESRLSDTDMLSPDDDPDLDALLSPDFDTPDEMEDSIMERLGEPPPAAVPTIPELSAAEERAEARSWRSVIIAGLERRIDMKVIEPYKRVLSHGGYLSAGSHNAIIVFSACFLPDRSRVDYDYVMDNLFLYVLMTLDQLITEDYVLIYLHGATSRSCMPTFSWLKRCYQMIDRRLRKNLKGLYLVHPTFWLKTIVLMTRPFISSKFSRKLSFVESLAELADVVPLEQASIPDRVKQYDQIRQSMEQGN
ncbi:uncharacterized protein [Periplaneta americana]|uniref:uncharacterized protein isoform X2 n=1 Tax=Periplaneta americana TaxID=6978 RepID=UPI0037E8E7F4